MQERSDKKRLDDLALFVNKNHEKIRYVVRIGNADRDTKGAAYVLSEGVDVYPFLIDRWCDRLKATCNFIGNMDQSFAGKWLIIAKTYTPISQASGYTGAKTKKPTLDKAHSISHFPSDSVIYSKPFNGGEENISSAIKRAILAELVKERNQFMARKKLTDELKELLESVTAIEENISLNKIIEETEDRLLSPTTQSKDHSFILRRLLLPKKNKLEELMRDKELLSKDYKKYPRELTVLKALLNILREIVRVAEAMDSQRNEVAKQMEKNGPFSEIELSFLHAPSFPNLSIERSSPIISQGLAGAPHQESGGGALDLPGCQFKK